MHVHQVQWLASRHLTLRYRCRMYCLRRVYCTYMQAIWYFGAAHILHEGRVAWDTRHPLPDMAPAAFVPVPFVFLMNVCSLCMFLGTCWFRVWALGLQERLE